MIDSAEASAEASVKVTEASVSAETNFSRFGRSLVANISKCQRFMLELHNSFKSFIPVPETWF